VTGGKERKGEKYYEEHILYDIAYIHGMDRVGCEYGSLGAFIVSDGFMSFLVS